MKRRFLFSMCLTILAATLFCRPVFAGENDAARLLNTGDSVEMQVECEDAGDYCLYAVYEPLEGYGNDILADLYIDGAQVSPDSGICFDRVFRNEKGITKDFEKDYKGDELRPVQEQLFEKRSICFDGDGEIISLSKGTHTLKLTLLEDGVRLYGLALQPYSEPESYEAYISGYSGKKNPGRIFIEGESAGYKSSSNLFPASDISSAATSPSSPENALLNIIGGANWSGNGQWLSWRFYVPESGLYQLALRCRQNVNMGMNSYRRVYIDGAVPFSELLYFEVKSANAWQEIVLGDEEPYYIYLEKGPHTIRLEVTSGAYAGIIADAKKQLARLNELYRSILAITGAQPDIYRDYSINEVAPEILTGLSDCAAKLRGIENRLTSVTNGASQGSGILRQLYTRMEKMAKKHREIAKNLSEFKSENSAMGTWVKNIDSHPLEIDYIVFGKDGEKTFNKSGILSQALFAVKKFIFSFITDYNSVDKSYDKTVTVWIGSGYIAGTDQMTVLKSVISDQFQNDYNIGVNVKLTAAGSLLSATLAGIGPDVALQSPGSSPVDYGLRNAVVDLYEFHDIQEVLGRFHESAYEPFRFDGKLYALPETQSYTMLFYRKDILADLGVDAGRLDTWDDIFQGVLPELGRKYMDFGMAPALENYLTLLYQRGGSLYLNGGGASGLSSQAAVNSFYDFTQLYDSYKIPVTYDFLNRFRTGEMPLAIADFTVYNQLSVFAPEIKGLWEMTLMPGTLNEDGTVNRSCMGASMGCVLMSGSKDRQSAWEFIKWWTSSDAQYEFGSRLEDALGDAARYPSANLEAFSKIKWNAAGRQALNRQRESLCAVPQVAGGYITARYFDFCFRDVVYSGKDVRETMNTAVLKINRELASKRQEFGIADNG